MTECKLLVHKLTNTFLLVSWKLVINPLARNNLWQQVTHSALATFQHQSRHKVYLWILQPTIKHQTKAYSNYMLNTAQEQNCH